MSDNLSEIVGQDVNMEAEQPAPEAEHPEQAAQEQAAEPAAEQTQQEPQEPQEPDARVVPLAALHEERARRKELAADMQRMRDEQARRDAILEQRLAALTNRQQQEQVPPFEENPAAHLKYGQEQLQQTVQATAQQIQAWQQQQSEQVAIQRLSSVVAHNEAAFMQQSPDYQEAVDYLRNQRVAEIVADGGDEAQAAEMAKRELMHFALARANAGQNPAEVAYKLAKARGYATKAAPAQQLAPAEKLQNQQRVGAASRSIGNGGPANNKLSLESLATMTDEEFAAATSGGNWQKVMGG